MSVKLPKRLSSKKKNPPKDNAQTEVLHKLGLEAHRDAPLDPASLLDISTWKLENQAPLDAKDLPKSFLHRLWLLCRDARSTCCQTQHNVDDKSHKEMGNGFEGESQSAINPLDLVTAVFMSADTFLQQEMTMRMVLCQFAVPLVLPNIDPEEPSHFLLWPLRGVVSQWRSHSQDSRRRFQEGDLASTCMPLVSCVKLGHCSVSKSQVLNHILSGLTSGKETFLHRGMDGGQLPRTLSNGLVEIAWYLPTGDVRRDIFSIPVVISNLRGEASAYEKCLSLLCQASSVVVVFCGDLKEPQKQLLISCKDMASKLILIDFSETQRNEHRVVGFFGQNLKEQMGLPEGSVLTGGALSEKELATKICDTLKKLMPDRLKLVTLEAAAKFALELGLNVDEGSVCKKAKALGDEVLKGLDEGSAEFKVKQLPLQGPLWGRLSEIEKEESKQRKERSGTHPRQQIEWEDILAQLRSYRMTQSMKIFTDTLFTADNTERTYFLTWIKLRLQLLQTEKPNSPQNLFTNLQTERKDVIPEHLDEMENDTNDNHFDSDSFSTVSMFEGETEVLPVKTELPVSEQECEIDQVSNHILELMEMYEEPQTQQKEHPESINDPARMQELEMESNKKEIQGEEIIESKACFDEQISHPVSENQSCHLQSGRNSSFNCQEKQLDEPEVTTPMPDSASSAKQQMCLDISDENGVSSHLQPFEPDPSTLGLEHFLREMALIFELTHISPGSGSHNVLRLPGLAADLLLYGIPLELMDGDASNIPIRWLSSVFAELQRRLPDKQFRIRVLTNLGIHHARNAEILSALFGVKFPQRRRRSTRGVYMVALSLPGYLRQDMACDFLLLIDVEGLCSVPLDNNKNMLVHDNEMATFAAGLSDVLMQNISPHAGDEFETDIAFIVSALLRIKECGSIPICLLLVQDVEINTLLHASQLQRVSKMLQAEGRETNTAVLVTSSINCVKGPWSNISLNEPVDSQYSEAVLKLKGNLFEDLKKCAAKSESSSLNGFMSHLCVIWDAVKAESFSIGLQNTDIALAFSLLCTKLSKWNNGFVEHMEKWLMGAKQKIFATKVKSLDTAIQNDLLSDLKKEAREEIIAEADKVKSKVEAYLMENDPLRMYAETFRPILMRDMCDLQDGVTKEITQKLETITENYCSSSQMKKFQTLLEKEEESVLHALIEKSKSSGIFLQDTELEEVFESVWTETLSKFDFRSSETYDVTATVINLLRQNLTSRGLQKHMKKVDAIGPNQTNGFQVYDEHFGYRNRVKHAFEARMQRLKAQELAGNIIEGYNQFVADKYRLQADFSDSYITELWENVEKALQESSLELRTAFEVDLKVHLCNAACQDFQKLHDHFAKQRELLACITATKSRHSAEFIYSFRKRQQCHRLAQAFTSLVFKPTALDFINRPLGMHIVEEILAHTKHYQAPLAFHQSLLEELIKEDHFESFLEYLRSYDNFRLKKIQKAVEAHISESTQIGKWREQRLGEIVGKIATAVSQTTEGTSGVLSDGNLMLERVCLTLNRDEDVHVNRAPLIGPLFSFTTEWDSFVRCLMASLATMHLNLAQELSQNENITQLLNSLPDQPQHCLLNRVCGCDEQCPFCGAPCDEETGHEVHKALFHRPKGLLPYSNCSVFSISCSENTNEGNPSENEDTEDVSMTCEDIYSLYPDWNMSPDDPNSQKTSDYWRYVSARFNERFAEEFKQEPAKIPEEWRKITLEEVLDSLK